MWPIKCLCNQMSKLCDLSSEVLKPSLTSITNTDFKNFKDTPIYVSDWPSHKVIRDELKLSQKML